MGERGPPRVVNPFERGLVASLSAPLCSPGMFKIRESAAGFKWDIEQVAVLEPAHIEACSSQFAATPDPALEKKAKEAIERFFSQEIIVPSPLSEVIKRSALPTENMEKKSFSDECTQTELTFPAILPPDVENALKPYFSNATKESVTDPDVSANASLRRKLCFEEFSDEDDPISIMEHVQYSSGISLRGLKRTLDSSFENSIISNAEINIVSETLNMASYKTPSPVCNSNLRHSNDIGQSLESPSFSPIRRVSTTQKNHDKCSDTSDISHDCNSSIFSQSTPEKPENVSKSSANSSADAFDTSETHQVKAKFDDDICKFGKINVKINKCSQSEFSICTTGKNASQLSTDYMDVSCEFSSFSRNQSPTRDLIAASKLPGNTVVNFDSLNKNPIMINSAATANNPGNACNKPQFFNKSYISDKSAMNCDSYDQLSEFYQHLTPKKNNREYLSDLIKSPIRKSSYIALSSPARMSLDNSFNIDTDKLSAKECLQPIHDFNMVHDASIHATDFSYNLSKSEMTDRPVLQRLDTGYLEQLANSNSTICNSTKYNTTLDVTKSFQSKSDVSNARWKRFDSGFHEEISSDFNQQMHCNDSLKFNNKFSTVSEYLEDQENLVNFNKFFNAGAHSHESMSMSDIFNDDLVSLRNSNFSSTPSKNRLKK